MTNKSSTAVSVTQLLKQYQGGDKAAFDALMPLVYNELKMIAANSLGRSGFRGTLSPTSLVHDAFVKLRNSETLALKDRIHFFAIAANCMRWLLTDYARGQRSQKRGQGALRVTFNEELSAADAMDFDLASLEGALSKLARRDPVLCRIVELRYLVGLSLEETAELVSLSVPTVRKHWLTARAWLARELSQDEDRLVA